MSPAVQYGGVWALLLIAAVAMAVGPYFPLVYPAAPAAVVGAMFLLLEPGDNDWSGYV